jgi:DNA invertase Pin-like site-specific DNA recombinase
MRLDFCVACGSRHNLEHHHLKARVFGGGDEESNMVTFCESCHDICHGWSQRDRRELIYAGLEKAKASGVRLGRPATSPERVAEVLDLRTKGLSIRQISRALGMSTGTVQRSIKAHESSGPATI